MAQKIKYPSTPHLPYSLSRTMDDKVLSSVDHLIGKSVVATIKYDGEQTNMYCDDFHARSLDGRHHPSRDWAKSFHASIAHLIPEGWRVCGENVYARHSLGYTDLPSYFLGFSIWNENNVLLNWDETLEYFELLGITPVKQIYRGPFEPKIIEKLITSIDTQKDEGLVIRLDTAIPVEEFGRSFAKWVRAHHVQTDEHWMHGPVIANGLADRAETA